jgi:hypothetical protein
VPDRRTHRGPHPEDVRLFTPEQVPELRQATADLCWLLSRGYAHESSLKLVGDRYALLARQRIAVARCACSQADAAWRRERQVGVEKLPHAALLLDGYNVLTTIEAALSGGVILVGRDGAYRDMASMHGSYRKVAETRPALELLGEVIEAAAVEQCCWYLDRPVSNSGRLKGIIEQIATAHRWSWQVELVPNPDVILVELQEKAECASPLIIATADSAVLDRCRAWFNLAGETILAHIPDANVLDLGASETAIRQNTM